jgi:glc operon protein GlcG
MELAEARLIVDAALDRAEQLGVAVSCCVVDASCHEVLTARMPTAFWFTPHVARTKARTSVTMAMDSGQVAGLAADYPDLVPLIDEQLPFTLTTLEGGMVITTGGAGGAGQVVVVGAVGVSGATPEQDLECATAGLEAGQLGAGQPATADLREPPAG